MAVEKIVDLGPLTAYDHAVEGGYTGTQEEFEQMLADLEDAATDVREAVQIAEEAAQNANEKATLANTAASNADTKAALANTAASNANTAAESAYEAEQAAITAAGSANTASSTANAAAQNANTARDAANTAATNANEKATEADEAAERANEIADTIDAKISTDSETVSGNPITVETDSAQVAKHTVLSFAPKQSGSGDPSPTNIRPIEGVNIADVKTVGKNLIPMTVNTIKSINTVGRWSGDTYTLTGIIFKLIKEGNKVLGISISGSTPPTNVSFKLSDNNVFKFKDDTSYILTGNSRNDIFLYHTGYDSNAYYQKTNPITIPGDSSKTGRFNISVRTTYDGTEVTLYPMLRLSSVEDDTFEPYQEEIIIKSLPNTVYSGTLDLETGALTVNTAVISSYDGEELPGSWISDRDVYVQGTTPTIGAQVVYELETPLTYQLTPDQLSLFKGINYISTDGTSLDLTYRKGAFATLGDLADEYERTNDKLEEMFQQIGGLIADSDQIIATKNHAVGDVFICGNELYKATDSIASGETLIEGSNVTKTTIIAVIAEQIQAAMNQ